MNAGPESPTSFSPGRRFRGALHAFLGVAEVLALVIMANYLAGRHGARWFVSTQTELRLSPQTRGLLRTITNEITVTVFYDRKDPFFNTIKGLLREYVLANPRLRVRDVDYLRDAGAAQQVFAQYQLAGTTNKNLIIFACATNVLAVPGDSLVQYSVRQLGSTDPQTREFERRPVAFYGEKAFTVAILGVTSPKPLKAFFLTGHDEHSVDSAHETQGYAKFGALLRQNVILTFPLSLAGTNTVPDDCNLLIVAGPLRAIPPAELDKIEQYLTQGGRLLALFNSYSSPRQCGLEGVLAKWGVQVSTPAVVDAANTVSGPDVKAVRFNAHPMTQPLLQSSTPPALHLWQPRAVVRQPVASPSADAPIVAEAVLSGEAATLGSPPATRAGGWSLVAAVEKGAVKGVVTERGTTRMVVFGDSFFLGNQMIESANNMDLAAHTVNWLLDRAHLLHSLGPKPISEFRLVLSASQMRLLRWALLAGLPGAVLLLGGLVWLRRRS